MDRQNHSHIPNLEMLTQINILYSLTKMFFFQIWGDTETAPGAHGAPGLGRCSKNRRIRRMLRGGQETKHQCQVGKGLNNKRCSCVSSISYILFLKKVHRMIIQLLLASNTLRQTIVLEEQLILIDLNNPYCLLLFRYVFRFFQLINSIFFVLVPV